ncbi:hypothetical protein [Pseudomonas sp. MWU12-2323]|uniref:hypothetical protein n=1 Tax=Pseudomonas sp. MWU12-2323 TaxID=2651296 RepID=UPI001C49B077|nr:hypothetical protein [Pseudomonas sp. MWU12-2323]
MVVDITGQHDQIGLHVRDGKRFVVLKMQVGQNANLHDADLLNAVPGASEYGGY